MYLKTAKTGGGGHPLINSELGKWIDHMKGARKDRRKKFEQKDLMESTQWRIGMKFSLWTQYGALNSKPIFDAFAT